MVSEQPFKYSQAELPNDHRALGVGRTLNPALIVRLDGRQLHGENSRQGVEQDQTIAHYPTGELAQFGPGLTSAPGASVNPKPDLN